MAQRKAAGTGAQAEEEPRKLRSRTGGDDEFLSVAVQLDLDVRRSDRGLRQRQARLVLQRQGITGGHYHTRSGLRLGDDDDDVAFLVSRLHVPVSLDDLV